MIPGMATVNGTPHASAVPTLAVRSVRLCAWVLLLIGLSARLSPLSDIEHRLFWQYMTEDGYLMQTIARNMAIGLGMTSSAGTIATNGVQPLATFFFAGLHAAAAGSKLDGIALVTLLSALMAAASAWYAWRVGQRVLVPMRHGRELSLMAAMLWFAAPHTIAHSMNGLETGLYYLAILVTLDHYLRLTGTPERVFGWKERVAWGVLMGIAFLARNDAVFFIGGLLVAHVLIGNTANGGRRHRLVDAIVAGLVSLLVASPWLVHNHLLFGTIVPISGISQSHAAALGENLLLLPSILLEAATSYVLVPSRAQTMLPVAVVSSALVLASLAGFWFCASRHGIAARRFYVAGVVFTAAVSCYYGLFFGAPHFLSRYTSSLAPFLWLGTCVVVVTLLGRLIREPQRLHATLAAIVAVLTLAAAASAAADYRKGTTHQHKQVVDWVQAHVPPQAWVGAAQTGTLGYFHDRTINLDGKVNPDALRARLERGHVLDYVADSKIQFLADWSGIADWLHRRDASPRFAKEFELVTRDDERNLAIIRRVQPLRISDRTVD